FFSFSSCTDEGKEGVNNQLSNNQDISADEGKIVAYNPILWADVPDPDVIRVDDTYYMTSTTMYFNPGVPIMKSYDLVHWELIGYVYDTLENSLRTDLIGEN